MHEHRAGDACCWSAWAATTRPLLRAREHYRKDWDEARKTFALRPRHDWASHADDAFRYLAMGLRPSRLAPRPPIKIKPPASRCARTSMIPQPRRLDKPITLLGDLLLPLPLSLRGRSGQFSAPTTEQPNANRENPANVLKWAGVAPTGFEPVFQPRPRFRQRIR